MKLLTVMKVGWPTLRNALESLVRGVNERTPVSGDGISVNEGPSGYTISLRAAPVLTSAGDGGSGLTADQIALLKALASDPGIQGTFPPTVPPTDHSHATTPGSVEFIPWKGSATSGWRKITYLETVTTDGVASNMLKDVWTWSGVPFNPRVCDADTWGG